MMTDYENYLSMTWTSADDTCEANCGNVLSENKYIEGRFGHYCSKQCKLKMESFPDSQSRKHERIQLGLTNF